MAVVKLVEAKDAKILLIMKLIVGKLKIIMKREGRVKISCFLPK